MLYVTNCNSSGSSVLVGDLLDVRIFCGRYFPFVVIPLGHARIIASKQVPTAGVDMANRMIINPDWWSTLTIASKRYVAIHECLHMVLCHALRAKGFNHKQYNISADGKVNYAIDQANLQGITFENKNKVSLHSLATLTNLPLDTLTKMSTEEIAHLLEKTQQQNQTKPDDATTVLDGAESFDGEDLFEDQIKGEVVQNGLSAFGESLSQEKLGKVWQQICEKAKTFAKQAGTLPSSLECMTSEVLTVKPPWRTVLRFGLRSGSIVDSSFAYQNRRSPNLPGSVSYGGTVWCLVDTSGSINQTILNQFLGIAKYEVRNASLRVVAWDAMAYEVLHAERAWEIARKVASKMKGGGGTACLPVLQKIHKLMGAGDAVIMLTDGDIYDAEKEETKKWFSQVANKAGFKMIGYTHTPIQAPGFNTTHITL